MADTHETHAEITAEMRFHGQQNIDAEKDKPEYGILTMEGRIALNYADRFDAAHKRERGNAAKLRDALKQVNELNDLWFDTFTLPDGATSIHDEIENIISAALAAPPRNCDVYNSESCRLAYHLNGDGLMTMQAFADWLFATATEKEGGAE